MPKNIVVFSDGTGQDGGIRPEQRVSNVYKMYRSAKVGPETGIDPAAQVAFYDPGLGTDAGATAITAPVRFLQKLLASVTGQGITANVADCYAFILDHYEPGDRIYLVGFSRGAYTVRCLANLLMLCGIPTRTPAGPLRRFRKQVRDIADEAVSKVLEQGAGKPRGLYEADRFEQARRFRMRYGSNAAEDPDGSNAAPYFIGVFDTVAALGARGFRRFAIGAGLLLLGLGAVAAAAGLANLIFGFPFRPSLLAIGLAAAAFSGWRWVGAHLKTTWYPERTGWRRWVPNWHFAVWRAGYYDRLLSRSVRFARSANAIDETRADFDRVPWGGQAQDPVPGGPPTFRQVWFAGNHSDIGGSYPEAESRLSDIALGWMVAEARALPHPLVMEDDKLRRHPRADGVQHCEIAGMHDTIERHIWRFLRPLAGKMNWEELPNGRDIKPDAVMHPTVPERFALSRVTSCSRSGPYRPRALRAHHMFKEFYASQAAAPSAAGTNQQPPSP
ncbi:uncharacterized protein (DUF2235 family) [Methylobacterium fujisawaense]|uniref:Uncharacterized protein (DUF2235 family) n=1 Tax=Methylobacterium fujisawaense TaxID=107400 RepID=A0ABR6D696_9HYPH|nr:DUF2235 domain-containing protein [Methylobacterium fujisawaense]MBA9061610.1 uncharacterized protein (DUF2235 family) [Methylobacterium fujisawaense]